MGSVHGYANCRWWLKSQVSKEGWRHELALCLPFSPEIVIIHDLPSLHAPHSETGTENDFGVHIIFPCETENHMNVLRTSSEAKN